MKKKCFILILSALAAFSHASEYMLYWQVTDAATVDNVNIDDYFSLYAQSYNDFDVGGHSGKIAGARAVAFEDGSDTPILMSIAEHSNGSWHVTAFEDTFIINDIDAVVGTGGGLYSRIAITDPIALSFAVELGNWENGEWVTLASSERVSYTSLIVDLDGSKHIWGPGDTHDLSNFQPWTPNAYAVPEPGTGLLLLIGIAVILLKRPFIKI